MLGGLSSRGAAAWSCLATALAVTVVAHAAGARAASCAGATNQVEMNGRAGAALVAAESALDETYREIIARLGNHDATRRRLRVAQRAWVDFRDKECAFTGAAAEGGSSHPLVVSSCKAALTASRTEALRKLLHCREGDLGCPVPAR